MYNESQNHKVLIEYVKNYVDLLKVLDRRVKIVLASDCCLVAANDNKKWDIVKHK